MITGFFRFILIFLIFYLVFKAIKYFVRLFSSPPNESTRVKKEGSSKSKLNIKKEDIIDAKFEDIDPADSKDTNQNSN